MKTAASRSRSRDAQSRIADPGAWLTGKVRDDTGDRLTPTHTTRKGRRLRYYVSNRLISGGPDPSGWRLPGPALEQAVRDIVASHLQHAAHSHAVLARPDAGSLDTVSRTLCDFADRVGTNDTALCSGLLSNGSLAPRQITLTLDGRVLAKELGVEADDLEPTLLQICSPVDLRRRGVEAKIIAGDTRPQPDLHLRAMLIRAHGWARDLKSGVQLSDIAACEKIPGAFIRTRAQLAFLSPKIQTAILDGKQPPELTLKRLVSVTHPLDWAEQERIFGFS